MEQIIVIDLGNTRSKYAIYEGDKMVESAVFDLGSTELKTILSSHHGIKKGMLSTVCGRVDEVLALTKGIELKVLDAETELPFTLAIDNPKEMGADLLAGAACAYERFPKQNVLIIDMGSCITYLILNSQGECVGGAISPGINMRLKAMHDHTVQLPMVQAIDNPKMVGSNTISCIQSGVINGVKAEIEGFINRYSEIYDNLIVFLGGGDNILFDKKLKNPIFADSNLVMEGLRILLAYNTKTQTL